ncbi:MAG TPA: cbb3-type cytochrome c oxidase subunit I, partial [Halococcus sp.]|nr:cbb3-type cytochrome c oxidase subunit I [Halococcus sp.]
LARWHFWLSMVGTHLTFFAMLILGYLGMPRRYATYDFPLGPVETLTVFNQIATLGAFLIFIGQAIWVWNMVQSWYQAPMLEDTDPWNLKESNQFTHEWQWNERRLETAIADGGADTTGDSDEN